MRILLIIPFFCLFLGISAVSQNLMTGPTCVIPGTEYRYLIGGNKTSQSLVNICIQGGHLAGTDSTCYQGPPVSAIQVVWNENSTSGHITISTGSNSTALDVSVTRSLSGGKIDSLSTIQIVTRSALPATIACDQAQGGGCSPVYYYQWQQSSDNLSWQNIDNANAQNLVFTSPVVVTTYYRRQVSEVKSNSSRYSNVAAVIVPLLNPSN